MGASLTAEETAELVGYLMAQGWHSGPATTLAAGRDAAVKLAMFRLTARRAAGQRDGGAA